MKWIEIVTFSLPLTSFNGLRKRTATARHSIGHPHAQACQLDPSPATSSALSNLSLRVSPTAYKNVGWTQRFEQMVRDGLGMFWVPIVQLSSCKLNANQKWVKPIYIVSIAKKYSFNCKKCFKSISSLEFSTKTLPRCSGGWCSEFLWHGSHHSRHRCWRTLLFSSRPRVVSHVQWSNQQQEQEQQEQQQKHQSHTMLPRELYVKRVFNYGSIDLPIQESR